MGINYQNLLFPINQMNSKMALPQNTSSIVIESKINITTKKQLTSNHQLSTLNQQYKIFKNILLKTFYGHHNSSNRITHRCKEKTNKYFFKNETNYSRCFSIVLNLFIILTNMNTTKALTEEDRLKISNSNLLLLSSCFGMICINIFFITISFKQYKP